MATRRSGWGMAAVAPSLCVLGFCALTLCPSAQAAELLSRRAVVIGNTAYTAMPPLPGCDASSRTAAATLRRAGFEVTLLSNPTNARMGAALAGLGDQAGATPDIKAVAYVCGYVSTFRDRLFLLPVEASITQDAELLTQGILGRVAYSAVANAGAGLLLMDAQPRPGNATPVQFGALNRQGDGAHSGFAVSLGPLDSSVAARLASNLAETLEAGQLEAGSFLAGLAARPSRAATTLNIGAPTMPAWLVGDPTPAPTPIPAPVQARPPEPPPTTQAALTPPPTPPNDEPAILSTADINQIQTELKRIGYYRGITDGRIGPETIVAIRLFQRELGADVTGRLTRRQVERLLRR